jgi:hypothetical protein
MAANLTREMSPLTFGGAHTENQGFNPKTQHPEPTKLPSFIAKMSVIGIRFTPTCGGAATNPKMRRT